MLLNAKSRKYQGVLLLVIIKVVLYQIDNMYSFAPESGLTAVRCQSKYHVTDENLTIKFST